MRHWTSVLTAIIPGFAEESLHGTLSVPDQILADAQRLIPMVESHHDKLPENNTLLADLNTLLTAATAEWNDAQRMLAEHAALEANVGTTKEAFHLPFMSLRTTLHRLLGPTHRDCLQLRLKTTRKGNDEEESEEETGEEATQTDTGTDGNKRNAA